MGTHNNILKTIMEYLADLRIVLEIQEYLVTLVATVNVFIFLLSLLKNNESLRVSVRMLDQMQNNSIDDNFSRITKNCPKI